MYRPSPSYSALIHEQQAAYEAAERAAANVSKYNALARAAYGEENKLAMREKAAEWHGHSLQASVKLAAINKQLAQDWDNGYA